MDGAREAAEGSSGQRPRTTQRAQRTMRVTSQTDCQRERLLVITTFRNAESWIFSKGERGVPVPGTREWPSEFPLLDLGRSFDFATGSVMVSLWELIGIITELKSLLKLFVSSKGPISMAKVRLHVSPLRRSRISAHFYPIAEKQTILKA